MNTREIIVKNILSKSKVFEYSLNPYVGCQHNCVYCYAKFVKKFTRHEERWGDFVDVKINAPELLSIEIKKKKKGHVWLSGVCDPYQPLEERYKLSRKCLEILIENAWPVTIQTKSPLVLRDLELLKNSSTVEVCLTITTADENIRKIFEPNAPSIKERISALHTLCKEGLKTHVMIAPLLLGAERLVNELKEKIDYVIIDKMNYHYADWIYKKYRIEWARKYDFFIKTGNTIKRQFEKENIFCQILF